MLRAKFVKKSVGHINT